MDIEKILLEEKAKIRMIEIKISALLNMLEREGAIVKNELDDEIGKLIDSEKNGE